VTIAPSHLFDELGVIETRLDSAAGQDVVLRELLVLSWASVRRDILAESDRAMEQWEDKTWAASALAMKSSKSTRCLYLSLGDGRNEGTLWVSLT
jgi:hypothetical protein